jgi:holo-[acyl-carrier protein] synthase
MIAGIGLDVVELERMAKLLEGPAKDKFVARVLTEQERMGWNRLQPRRALEYISGRFAAKEAVVKALGTGIGAIVGFMDIEVLPDALGKPVCLISQEAIQRLGWEGHAFKVHIAITHERTLAVATAIIEK